MVRGVRKGTHERKKIYFYKNGSVFNSLNPRTDHSCSVQQITSLKSDDVKLHTKQRHLNGDTVNVQYAVLRQNRKFRLIRSNLV